MLGFFIIMVTGRLRGENQSSEIKLKRMVLSLRLRRFEKDLGRFACWVGRYKASLRFSLEALPRRLPSIVMERVRKEMDHGEWEGRRTGGVSQWLNLWGC